MHRSKQSKMKSALNRDKDEDKDLFSSPREKLNDRGIYYITGYIDEDELLDIHQDILLKHMDTTWQGDVQLVINSYGGLTSEGWALIDLLDWVRMDVRTIAIGYCASQGACLACCGTPGKRVIAPNTALMVHGAHWGAEGTVQQMVAVTEQMKREHDRDVRFWLKHSKYTRREDIEKIFLHGKSDVFLEAEEAVKHGIIDGIIGQPKPEPPVKKVRSRKK